MTLPDLLCSRLIHSFQPKELWDVLTDVRVRLSAVLDPHLSVIDSRLVVNAEAAGERSGFVRLWEKSTSTAAWPRVEIRYAVQPVSTASELEIDWRFGFFPKQGRISCSCEGLRLAVLMKYSADDEADAVFRRIVTTIRAADLFDTIQTY